jgi:predicted Ser/Thr protein kinase
METKRPADESPFAAVTRHNIEDYVVQCLRPGGGTRPALWLLQDRGRRAIVKDYSPCGWVLRTFVARWLVDREERIYRTLDGAEGVPSLIGRLDDRALVVEHIAGRACSDYPRGSLPPEFFQRLQRVVEGIHRRGVVHCDIKNRSNIVVTEDLNPYVIDYVSAFTREGRGGRLRSFAFDRFRHDDERAVVKTRLRIGRVWNEEDARFAFHRGPAERVVRAVRNTARRLLQLIAHR